MTASIPNTEVQVLIVGAGPVGLIIGFGLQRMGITTAIVEKKVRAELPMYGHAASLYPATLEHLDRYGLLDDFNEIGFQGRSTVTYRDGKRVVGRGWTDIVSGSKNSFVDFPLNIRLKYSEDILEAAYREAGGRVIEGWELIGYRISITSSGQLVESEIREVKTNASQKLVCSYLIGADGAHSKVRELSGIKKPHVDRVGRKLRWIRIDGVIETDMPNSAMGNAAIESRTHGNVLWLSIDHGRTRIGLSLPEDVATHVESHDSLDRAIEEAKKAMLPFKIDFKTVDWYTFYNIGQGLAEAYVKDDCIILAGDACHTHSSAAAQGMNTGVHDAVNIAWKLAGVIKGWYPATILRTYQDERKPIAEHLIQRDLEDSKLISGIIPEQYKGTSVDVNELLKISFRENMPFLTGLGIKYGLNTTIKESVAGNLESGMRAPDLMLHKAGRDFGTRLYDLMPNFGAFYVLIFVGGPSETASRVQRLIKTINGSKSMQDRIGKGMIKFITIINGNRPATDRALGCMPLGRTAYDHDGLAHRRYGFSLEYGGITVVRPDGVIGYAVELDDDQLLEDYFAAFSLHR